MQSFPRSVGHVTMSIKNWFGPVKGYSLLDQIKYFVYDRYKQLMVDVDLNNH